MPIQSIHPATGSVLRTFPALTEQAMREKIDTCARAFEQHRNLPLEHRALCMRKLAVLLEEDRADLARVITLEMGKPITAAEGEIDKCADACRFFAGNAARFLAPEMLRKQTTTSGQAYVQYEPLGMLLAVMPWNFPLWQVFRFAVPALLAGNTVLLKHAPSVPQCALQIENLFRRAGFLRGALTTLLVEVEVVEAILNDPRVKGATLTGSEGAGRAIAAQSGWLLKKTVLELGGSDPFLVMPSANVEAAAEAAVKARMVNGGQSCIAAKRFIVHNDVFGEFQQRFVAGMEALRIGDPMKPETEVGPMHDAHSLTVLEGQIRDCVAAGGRIVTGGTRMVGSGYFFEPTVLVNVPRHAPVYRQEIFGPVALLFRANSLDDALAIANDTPFGLGASVWTSDPSEQQALLNGLEAGMVFLNQVVASDPRLPFGGTKQSGYGRELGAAGMREFLNAKTVVIV